MSLLRKPQSPILQSYNSLKINMLFQENFGKKDFSEGTQISNLIFSIKFKGYAVGHFYFFLPEVAFSGSFFRSLLPEISILWQHVYHYLLFFSILHRAICFS